MVVVVLILIASIPAPLGASLTAQEPSAPEPPVTDVIPEPTGVPGTVPEPTVVPTVIPTAPPTLIPTIAPTATAAPPSPTAVPTAAPLPTPAPSIGIMSIDPGTGDITGCTQSGSDQLQPGGTVTSTCQFSRFGSHPADFTVGAPTSTVSGAASGWQIQLSFGAVGTGWVSTQTTYRAPADATSFTVSLRAPGTGGVPGATVTSRIDLQSCNPGGSCQTGTTTKSAQIVRIDLGRVTMSCTPASPAAIVRLQSRVVTCTVRVPTDIGATTSVAIRSVTIPAAPSGWGVVTSPTGTTNANGSVTISPNRMLGAGQAWSFTLTLAPACTASSSGSWAITSRIAPVVGGVSYTEVAGPSVTYTATATTPVQTTFASLVSSTLDWSLPFALTSQTASGTLTYRVTGAGCSGWSVSVAARPFTYTGSAPGSSIPANNVTLTTARPPSVISGNGTGVATTGATGGLGTARKVISAQSGAGNGTFQQVLDVSVTIPAAANIGTYRSTVTITTAAAP